MNKLGKKLLARLKWALYTTDKQCGMYPGDWWDLAEKQHSTLEGMGYVERFYPHNDCHKMRAIITDSGREVLESLGKGL